MSGVRLLALALLVCNTAGGLASGLAGGLALTAATRGYGSGNVFGFNGGNSFHENTLLS